MLGELGPWSYVALFGQTSKVLTSLKQLLSNKKNMAQRYIQIITIKINKGFCILDESNTNDIPNI